MTEYKFGNNGKPRGRISRKINRVLRPKYSYHRAGKVSAGAPIDWSKPYSSTHGSIKNQWSSYSCGGMAGSYLLEIIRLFNNLVLSIEQLSAKSIYSKIFGPGGGATVQDLETQLAVHGATLESEVPDLQNGICLENFMEDASWETPQLAEESLKRAGFTPMSVSIDIESMAEAIRDEGGLIIAIQGKNGQGDGWFAPYPTPPSRNNPNPMWEHFMCCFGYQSKNGVKQIDALQSWGPTVGDGGIQHFRDDYINSGYIVDAFVLIPDSKLTPGSSIGLSASQQMWQSVCLWFKRQPWFK